MKTTLRKHQHFHQQLKERKAHNQNEGPVREYLIAQAELVQPDYSK